MELAPGGGDIAVGLFYCYKRPLAKRTDTFYNSMAAAAGLGGLEL
jgi:hypothetical protein